MSIIRILSGVIFAQRKSYWHLTFGQFGGGEKDDVVNKQS
jgi:hypothetical protein